ncbi:hypothetical protein Tco_1273108 [Tanacetum coccineum]
MDTPLDFSAFMLNRLKVDTLTPELLAGPTFKLMKGSCKSVVKLEYFLEEVCKATTDQLDWNNPEGQQYLHDLRKPLPLIPNSRVTKTKAADYGHIKWIEEFVPNSMESAHDVYSKHRILAVTKLKIVEWHNYKHLDWITVHENDDKLYTFKEDQISNEKHHIQHTLIPKASYQNKGKKNRLTRIDKLHKFSDGTLNDVRSALDDILKNRRLLRILEKFIGGRLYRETFSCWKGPYDLSYDVLMKTGQT